MSSNLCALPSDAGVIGFNSPGVLGIGRDDVVIGSSIRCGVVDLRV